MLRKFMSFFDYIGSAVLVILLSIICCVISVPFSVPRKEIHIGTEYLVSLQDGKEVEGRITGGIFLTTGYIDMKLVYTGYARSGEGFKMISVDANKAVVFQANNEKPRVDFYNIVFDMENAYWWQKQIYEILLQPKGWSFTKAEIFIPVGSIIEDFTLDAN
jgi:hypothetical protein